MKECYLWSGIVTHSLMFSNGKIMLAIEHLYNLFNWYNDDKLEGYYEIEFSEFEKEDECLIIEIKFKAGGVLSDDACIYLKPVKREESVRNAEKIMGLHSTVIARLEGMDSMLDRMERMEIRMKELGSLVDKVDKVDKMNDKINNKMNGIQIQWNTTSDLQRKVAALEEQLSPKVEPAKYSDDDSDDKPPPRMHNKAKIPSVPKRDEPKARRHGAIALSSSSESTHADMTNSNEEECYCTIEEDVKPKPPQKKSGKK